MANEYKRSRVYYTKAQIQNGLVTEGREWMFVDTTEYIGQYHRYTTGEVFSEATWVQGKSRRLVPYIDVNSLDALENGINPTANYEYDAIKKLKINKSTTPNQNTEEITLEDEKKSYFDRYFVCKVNDGFILELSQEDYAKVGTKTGLTDVLWKKFRLQWKIKGPIHDILDSSGNIKESGVFDTNKRTVELYSEDYPELKSKLMDFTEYYTP